MKQRFTLALSAFVLLFFLTGCGAGDSDLQSEGITPQEFASRFQSALKKDGQIIHSMSTLTANVDGESTVLLEAESWVDLAHGLRRHQYDVVNEIQYVTHMVPPRQIIVIVGDQVTAGDGYGNYENEVRLCGDWSDCEHWTYTLFDSLMGLGPTVPDNLDFHPRVESGVHYRGENATALVHSWIYELGYEQRFLGSEEGTVEFKSSFFVQENSFLPVAWVIEYQFADGSRSGSFVATFENEIVSEDELPWYTFEPSSVYPETKAVLQLTDIDQDVYWLGTEFQLEGFQPLSPTAAGPAPGRYPQPGNVRIIYESPDERVEIWIESWRLEAWNAAGRIRSGGEESTLDGNHVVFFPPNPGGADVYLPDTVVSVWVYSRDYRGLPGEYESREALEAILRGLMLHNPGE